MNPKETTIILKCDCGCSMFVVEKSEWDDDVYINEPERFRKFVDDMNKLCTGDRKSP